MHSEVNPSQQGNPSSLLVIELESKAAATHFL
jgi:hypothetical protein